MLGMLRSEDVQIVEDLASQVRWGDWDHVDLLADFEGFGGPFLLVGT